LSETLAVIIGISSHSQKEISNIPGAEVDAVHFARALRNWGIPEDNIILLLNEEANKKNINTLLDFLPEVEGIDKLVFYFCGHGWRTQGKIPQSHLFLYDTHIEQNCPANSLPLDNFFEKLACTPFHESYIFVDACHLRVNHFLNPKLQSEIQGKTDSHKSIFCLLSSGIEKSFENGRQPYGYFTRSLLRNLANMRPSEVSPTQLYRKILTDLINEGLPQPDMFNYGNHHIAFFPKETFLFDQSGNLYRTSFLAKIQDALIQQNPKMIVIYGDENCGKTTLCQSLASEKTKTLYFEIPPFPEESFNPKIFLENEIFQALGCRLEELDTTTPYYLIILDQVERINDKQLALLLETAAKLTNTQFLLASRRPIESKAPLLHIPIPLLSEEEGKALAQQFASGYSESELHSIYLISRGNPLRIQQIAIKGRDSESIDYHSLTKAIAAIHSCEVLYDRELFEQVFHLKKGVIDLLERSGLLFPYGDGLAASRFLLEYAKRQSLEADPQEVATYRQLQTKAPGRQPAIAKSIIFGLIFLVAVVFFCLNYWHYSPPSAPSQVYINQVHPDFVGREKYFDLLETHLIKKRDDDHVAAAVLWGEGGIGKSEIAITFANRHRKAFNLIYWIDAGAEEMYRSSYQHLANLLNIPIDFQEPIEAIVKKVLNHLEQSSSSWLLVIDNAKYELPVPQRGNGAVIVTTRNQTHWHLYPRHEITPFDFNEAESLLCKIIKKEDSPARIDLIKELDGHPLALNLAAHYIAETPYMNEEAFTSLLSQNKMELIGKIPTNSRYQSGLITSWKMTAEQIHEKKPKALDWLHFCSYLYPGQIPLPWITEWLSRYSSNANPELEMNEILRLIVNQGIMRCDTKNKAVSIHRLKQEIFRLDDYFDSYTKEQVLDFLVYSFQDVERFDEMEKNTALWPRLTQWEWHAAWFLEHHADSCSREKVAQLNGLLGNWKMIKGEFFLAEKYIDEALAMRIERLGKSHLATILSLNNKGWLLFRTNKSNESKTVYKEAIKTLVETYGEGHPLLPCILNNLTLPLNNLQEYQETKRINKKVLEIRNATCKEPNAYNADSMHNLAISHLKLKEYDDALFYLNKALTIYLTVFDKEHPYVAITMHSIGRAHLAKGDFQQANGFLDRAFQLYTKLYGKEHLYSSLCLQNQGQLQANLGNEEKAFEIYKTALIQMKKIYENDNTKVHEIIKDLDKLAKESSNPSLKLKIKQLNDDVLNSPETL
jgi:tetratricopeptide (TPR) repeat protein